MEHEKAARIRMMFLDIDGVLTDGRIILNDRGEEAKSFHVRDGLGLKMLMAGGVDVVIVTGRSSGLVVRRAAELGIGSVYQGVVDKGALCRRLLAEKGLRADQSCAMGDDLPDLGMFRETGLRIAVSDAVSEVREAADHITRRKGGSGAVREACEWLLKSQGKWEDILSAAGGK